ncbi:MAG: translation initiation factor IF-2, partial [Defluviitaleaceae bacterium]|nr:translation initiation factor IF-2 [Defluviitaleaceae bacterium]
RQDGDRPRYQGDRPPRQDGDRPRYQGDRPPRQDGDRPRYQGDRPPRQDGDRPRYQGDRPPRQDGDRPRYQGDRPPRQDGDRPRYQGDRPPRQDGDRPRYQGDRPPRQDGDRPRYQGDRPPRQDGDKSQSQGSRGGRHFQKPSFGGARTGDTNVVSSENQQGDRRRQKGKQPRQEDKRGGKSRMFNISDEPQITATQKKKEKRKLQKKQAEERLLQEQEALKAAENDIKVLQIGKGITVGNLAEKLGKGVQEVIMPLMKIGIMANVNQEIDYYTASKIAEKFDIIVEPLEETDILEEAFATEDDNDSDMTERPPVVVVMGHVDHGKTSLLDAIRNTNVIDAEAGGITQHIGAYQVNAQGKNITFLDTPGHEAFTAMRMRGAQVTDIAILVVAADDGVMPQTIEAINHARAADVEIIVAINKIDKPQANLDRVKQELSEHGIVPEDWGGKNICVPVSAKQGKGIDDLLENILLVAEVKELKANPRKRARGTVIEANLDKGKGPVATVLIQEGTLSIGDPIVVGATYGKVRTMMDHKGNRLRKCEPSTPAEIVGLSEVPKAGDMLYVAASERQAGQVAADMVAQGRENMLKSATPKVSLDDLFDQIREGNVKELNIVIKADVQGSVEAVRNSLERLSNEEVRIKTIHGGVGQITESDIMLASASNAIIIAFNVRYDNAAKQVADAENVDIRLYRVIYNAIEDISSAIKGMLDPIYQEKVIGHAQIRQLFRASGVTIAGCYVTDGKIQRAAKVRIVRDGKVIHEGELAALRRFKDDVREVAGNYECGLSFEKYNDIKEGDVVESYIMEEVPR